MRLLCHSRDPGAAAVTPADRHPRLAEARHLVADVDRLWIVANIAVAAVAIPNLAAMLCLSGVFRKLQRDELSGERSYGMRNVDEVGPELRGAWATEGSLPNG